ncbi:MAG: hypothetical protein FWE31_06080 [Firmicutes bacterium]|nr:hypothetical protein [Bacillota bacterium]
MIRIFSFVVLVAAVISLVSFFIAAGSVVFDPFRAAFNPSFDFTAFGAALFGFMTAISVPLILAMLGIIGLSVKTSDEK